jgi:hypothetical protein
MSPQGIRIFSEHEIVDQAGSSDLDRDRQKGALAHLTPV